MERSDACKLPGGARYGSGCSLEVINSFLPSLEASCWQCDVQIQSLVQCTKLKESLSRVERIEARVRPYMYTHAKVHGKSVVVLRTDLSVNHILSCMCSG